ncbi:MAG: hypothetical protein Q7S15_00540 [bacterium]|nr:hypothetical protein [bacterium]
MALNNCLNPITPHLDEIESPFNRFVTWLEVGCPNREVTEEEARHHYHQATGRITSKIFVVEVESRYPIIKRPSA